MFIINFRGRYYGLTAKHVFKDFEISQLVVARDKMPQKGTPPAPIEQVALMAEDGDISDLAVILFTEDIDPNFFHGTAYVIDEKTVGSSDTAHKLKVYGYLKDKTNIDYDSKSVTAGYCDLEFRAVGETSSDHFIRSAMATYSGHDFTTLTGISGAPVFDETVNRLCGMVVRGALNNGAATIWYIDIFHINKALEAISTKMTNVSYAFYPAGNSIG